MDPRRRANRKTKSTNLPVEYLKNIKEVFEKAFIKDLNQRPIIVEGRLYPDELALSVGFKLEKEGLRQQNFEASIDYKGTNEIVKKVNACVDAISSMVEQYFEHKGELEFPLQWTKYKFENEEIHLRSSTRNTELENEANRLLGIDANEALYSEEMADEQLEEIYKKANEESQKDDEVTDDQDLEEDKDPRGTLH